MEMHHLGLAGELQKTLRTIQATQDKDFIWGGTESGKKAKTPGMGLGKGSGSPGQWRVAEEFSVVRGQCKGPPCFFRAR